MAKKLVAYFSASGTTEVVAKRLAQAAGADLFEIVPETIYTDADLDWRDPSSRCVAEMKDRSARPAIASHVADMSSYDTIFVGFPIWAYREPGIIDTFLESYDFSGKTLAPFATSGGSGMGECSDNFRTLAPDATVAEGRRFSPRATVAELAAWAEEL